MANKRTFKKTVDCLSGAICEDIMINFFAIKDIDKEKADASVARILDVTDAVRIGANHVFGKCVRDFADKKEYMKAKKAFFKKHFAELNATYGSNISEAIKEFNASVPDKIKEENKRAVSVTD